jgi:hypothetical protein
MLLNRHQRAVELMDTKLADLWHNAKQAGLLDGRRDTHRSGGSHRHPAILKSATAALRGLVLDISPSLRIATVQVPWSDGGT